MSISQPAGRASLPRIPRQDSLFPDEATPGARVIPFESITRAPKRPVLARPATKKRPVPRTTQEQQASLDFLAPPPSPRKLKTEVDAAVYCDSPVAPRVLRVCAALVDGLIAAIGAATVLTILFLKAGEMPLTRQALVVYGLIYAGMLGLYRLMSCVLAEHTLGAEWMGLRLLHFDGRPADVRLRLLRFASSLLSLLPAGAGLLWSLADEERLTWHDHISKTFLTTR